MPANTTRPIFSKNGKTFHFFACHKAKIKAFHPSTPEPRLVQVSHSISFQYQSTHIENIFSFFQSLHLFCATIFIDPINPFHDYLVLRPAGSLTAVLQFYSILFCCPYIDYLSLWIFRGPAHFLSHPYHLTFVYT